MARKVLIEIVDDLDGGAAAQTVPFALDGVAYEIDLSDENADALRHTLTRYIEAGQRIGGRRIKTAVGRSTASTGSGTTRTADRGHNQQVRAWALANGYEISERGRISREIYAAFEAGEQAAAPERDLRQESSDG